MVTIEPGKTRIGWIGTGVMGRWMCEHVMNKGYSATVYNRTKAKAQPLLERFRVAPADHVAVAYVDLLAGRGGRRHPR